MSETKWNEIKNTPGQFERYIDDLMTKANDDELIYVNDKIISIKSFKENNEFFMASFQIELKRRVQHMK